MDQENKDKISIGVGLILLTLIGTLAVLWFYKAVIEPRYTIAPLNIGKDGNTQFIKDVGETTPTDLQKYNSYKQVSIYSNGFETPLDYKNNADKALASAARKIKVVGEISDAFIYIKAGTNDERGNLSGVKPEYDGIWFYIQNGKFIGGQLDLSRSRFGMPSEVTELLFNLKEVPLAKNLEGYRKEQFTVQNLLNELVGEKQIGALVSTVRYGKIIDLKIGYKCAGDQDDCLIE